MAAAPDYTIRLATIADGPALAALRWTFRHEDGTEHAVVDRAGFERAYLDFYHTGLRDGSRIHFLAECQGAVVGHVELQRVDLVPRPCRLRDGFGVVTDNYVDRAHRQRGIGGHLLDALITRATSDDLELLIVWPSDRATPFYARRGFTRRNEVMELVLRPYA